jgi:hypothetical protein
MRAHNFYKIASTCRSHVASVSFSSASSSSTVSAACDERSTCVSGDADAPPDCGGVAGADAIAPEVVGAIVVTRIVMSFAVAAVDAAFALPVSVAQ